MGIYANQQTAQSRIIIHKAATDIEANSEEEYGEMTSTAFTRTGKPRRKIKNLVRSNSYSGVGHKMLLKKCDRTRILDDSQVVVLICILWAIKQYYK